LNIGHRINVVKENDEDDHGAEEEDKNEKKEFGNEKMRRSFDRIDPPSSACGGLRRGKQDLQDRNSPQSA